MIKAVIFDMFETLITHYESPLYFGAQIAEDSGIPEEAFFRLWRNDELEYQRTVGHMTLEQVLEIILRDNQCYSEELLHKIVKKRIACKEECFRHVHSEIIPMLEAIKEQGVKVGLISNCYSEEVEPIKNSLLFPYFDTACLSYEQGIQKPDKEIFRRCMEELSVEAKECLYVGDGGSLELETASALGMKALQAVWYFKDGVGQPSKRNRSFIQVETPLELLNYMRRL